MRETNLWHAGSILALGGWVSLAGASLGGENESRGPSNRSAASASESSTGRQQQQSQSNRRQEPRSDSDDHVHHHAALGVLIGNSQDGVSVVGIIPGSPAALAGLRVGDVIHGVGDQRIRTTQELTEEIREYHPGSAIDLSVRRDGERRVVSATLASQESTLRNRHQRIRTLQQQVARLQQELDRLLDSEDAESSGQDRLRRLDWEMPEPFTTSPTR